jgi:hypothetical protein
MGVAWGTGVGDEGGLYRGCVASHNTYIMDTICHHGYCSWTAWHADHEGTTILQNIINYAPKNSAPYLTRLESSPTPPWEHQISQLLQCCHSEFNCFWNLMAHAQKPDFVFRQNGRVHLNWRGRHFSRLLAAKVRASAVVLPDTPCSGVVWRVLATHSIRQFPLHFPSHVSPCGITFQPDSTTFKCGDFCMGNSYKIT